MPPFQPQIQFDLEANNFELNGTQIATLTAVLSNVNLLLSVYQLWLSIGSLTHHYNH